MAVTTNKLRRAQSDSALVGGASDDLSLAQPARPLHQGGFQSTVDELGDEHFAIAEATLDEARSQCEGNWIEQGHQEFRERYGQFVEYSECSAMFAEQAGADQEEQDDKCCQMSLGPNLCKRLFVSPVKEKYDAYFGEVVEILRGARDVRRRDGYVANHPLLLFCADDDEPAPGLSIRHIYLLARVSFNPFDATLLECTMMAESRATLAAANGFASLHRLPVALFRVAEMVEKYIVKTGSYKAVSLREIELDSSSLRSCSGEPVEDGSDNGEAEGETGILRANQTRLAMQKALQGSKANKQVKKIAVKKQRANKSSSKKKKGTEPIAADTADRSALVDDEIFQEWGSALQERLGPVASGSTAESPATSSSSSSKPAAASPCPIPVQSFTCPWRDKNGHCWVYKAETSKPYHLGS